MQQLDHERLDVYRMAVEFLGLAHAVTLSLPKGNASLSDQLLRAATSIVLNIAEGAGKTSMADKRRYYLSARGSANECAAAMDVLLQMSMLDAEQHRSGKETLVRIVGMLVRLVQSLEKRAGNA